LDSIEGVVGRTPDQATYRQALSSAERPLHAAAVWSTYSAATPSTATTSPKSSPPPLAPAQYHVLGVDVGVGMIEDTGITGSASDLGGTRVNTRVHERANFHRGQDEEANTTSTVAIPIFTSDLYPHPPTGATFAVRDWHRSAAGQPFQQICSVAS
jgi:hypothetical protein